MGDENYDPELVTHAKPRGHALSTICAALEEANVPERRAQNKNHIAGVVQYAVLDEIEHKFNELRYS